MGFERGEFVPKHRTTPPTFEVLLQVGVLKTRAPPTVVRGEGIVSKRNEEFGVEAVVVFSMLEAVRVHVPTDDMNVKVIHGWVSVDAHTQLP